MEGKERAELMDKIMDTLLIHKRHFDSRELNKYLNNPAKTHEHFMEILRNMKQSQSKCFDLVEAPTMDGVLQIKSTVFTIDFKNKGGF